MVKNIPGYHHYNLRRRIHKKHEKYPHPNKFKRFIDKLIYPVAFVGPIMTLPQVYKIWVTKNASGIMPITFFTYSFLSLIWLFYGYLHKSRAIKVSSFLWVILNFSIAMGAVIY